MDLDTICLKPFDSTLDHEKFLIANQAHGTRDWTDSFMASSPGLDGLDYLLREWNKSHNQGNTAESGKWFLEKYVPRINDGKWLELPSASFHTQQWDGSKMCNSIEGCQVMFPEAVTVSLRQTTNIPMPTWRWVGGCHMPPKDQLSIKAKTSESNSKHQRGDTPRNKIAFLLMEYNDITFPEVWAQYFGDSSDYVLYVHIQHRNIPETLDYHEFQSKHPNIWTAHASMSNMTQNMKLLETNTDAHYYHLMPILHSFWRYAIADESIVGFFPLSGACLPVKNFSALRQALIFDRSKDEMDYSILMNDNEQRKAELWGYVSRRAVSEIVVGYAGVDLGKKGACAGPVSEEVCPAQLIQHLRLPIHHGVIT